MGTQTHTEGEWPCKVTKTQGETSYENISRDASTGEETLRIASNHQKLGEKHGTDCPSALPVGTNSANTLISDF